MDVDPGQRPFLLENSNETTFPLGQKVCLEIDVSAGRIANIMAKGRRFPEVAVNNTTCPSCGSPMKRNGKTKSGSQRWRCVGCGASVTHLDWRHLLGRLGVRTNSWTELVRLGVRIPLPTSRARPRATSRARGRSTSCANKSRPGIRTGLENQGKRRSACAALRRYSAFASLPAVRARMLA